MRFLDYFLDTFVGTTGGFSINSLLDFFLPNGTLHLNTSAPVVLNISNSSALSFGVPYGLVAGLDTWTAFNLLNTLGGSGIGSSLTLQNLTLDFDLAFNLTIPPLSNGRNGRRVGESDEEEETARQIGNGGSVPPIMQTGYLRLHFNHTSLKQETIVPFDKKRWDNLTDGQPINPGCIFTASPPSIKSSHPLPSHKKNTPHLFFENTDRWRETPSCRTVLLFRVPLPFVLTPVSMY